MQQHFVFSAHFYLWSLRAKSNLCGSVRLLAAIGAYK